MNHLGHYGLRESPFGITPDTSFFYDCESIREGLNVLMVAAANGEGFIKITGEVGTGKTLLCRKFLATLDEKEWVSAYFPNPNMESRTLLRALAEELEIEIPDDLDEHRMLRAFNLGLLDFARDKKRVVLCLDETQAMPIETLETMRLLTNLETEKRKLIQVVLFGQPELDVKLADPSIRQLKQRIIFQHRLTGLTRTETVHYLDHRLRIAGYQGGSVFSWAASRVIASASRGTPRLINILAHKALMVAYGRGSRTVSWPDAREAVRDTPAVPAIGLARFTTFLTR